MKLTQFERYEMYNVNYVDVKDEVIIEHYGSLEHFEECLRTDEGEIYDWINMRDEGEIEYIESPNDYPSSKNREVFGVYKDHYPIK